MKKIRLSLESLEVCTFATDAAQDGPRGTVQGLVAKEGGLGTGPVDSCDETCWRDTCNPCGEAIAGAVLFPAGY